MLFQTSFCCLNIIFFSSFMLEKSPFTDKEFRACGPRLIWHLWGNRKEWGMPGITYKLYPTMGGPALPCRVLTINRVEINSQPLWFFSFWPRQWCQDSSWLQNEISSLSSQWKILAKSIALQTPKDQETFFCLFSPLLLSHSYPSFCGGIDNTYIWCKKLQIPKYSSQRSCSNEDLDYTVYYH